MVLVGGGQTWEWSGGSWAKVTPTIGQPSAWDNVASVYDPVRRRTVLFGGRRFDAALARYEYSDELQEWNGTAWSRGPSRIPVRSRAIAAR